MHRVLIGPIPSEPPTACDLAFRTTVASRPHYAGPGPSSIVKCEGQTREREGARLAYAPCKHAGTSVRLFSRNRKKKNKKKKMHEGGGDTKGRKKATCCRRRVVSCIRDRVSALLHFARDALFKHRLELCKEKGCLHSHPRSLERPPYIYNSPVLRSLITATVA